MENDKTKPNRMIFCKECQADVPVEELEDGAVLIWCPKCIGECAICDCHLAVNCFEPSTRIVLKHFKPSGGGEAS